jgi:5-methylcytosine-specific restriction protein A
MFHRGQEGWVRCELCERDVPPSLITQHHLKPKEKGGKPEHKVPLCRPCHKQVHATFGNAELAKCLDSLEALRSSPMMAEFLKWIRKQKGDRNFRTVMSTGHPKRRRRR